MVKVILIFIFSFFTVQLFAENQKLQLTASEIEALFIHQNLELIAEKLNISIIDAAVIQAKVWDNPIFSINGLNLWSTESQRGGETIPPFFGSFGRNTQFSIELTQMITISGKRAKLVNVEKISREMTLVQFEQILLGLKLELRKTVTNILYLEQSKDVLEKEFGALNELIASSEKQYEKGNLSKNELFRIQSALLAIEHEQNSIQIEINAEQKKLKNLLSENSEISISILPDEKELPHPETFNLSELTKNALEYRNDINLQKLQTEYYNQTLKFEKSKRIPDLNLSIMYDRRGGVWRDFVGFGVGIELPVFNYNQGAIKAAKISRQQSEILAQQQEKIIFNEITEAYMNYLNLYNFHQKTTQNKIITELDEMLKVYTKNLLTRNISMVEYMDFLGTYKNTKQITLATKRDVCLQLEDLEYVAAINKK